MRRIKIIAINTWKCDGDYFGGDFNCGIDSEEIYYLKNNFPVVACYHAGNGAEPRISRFNSDGFQLNRCVDHIFCLNDNKMTPDFLNSEIVLNRIDEATQLYPSDHFGISTTLIV